MTPAQIAESLRRIAAELGAIGWVYQGQELRTLADEVEKNTVDAGPWLAIGQALTKVQS